ncbi:dual specificity protein phosphatase family protein [Perilla frutescens var. frutescens]|nr:dual specificity protein phosphatase family protein [Perilla frutescens var. frutescens]
MQKEEEDREFDLASTEPDTPLPLTVTSRVLYMLGDITAGPAYRFAQWLELVRKRSSKYRASGFPHRPHHTESMLIRLVYALMSLILIVNVASLILLIEICVLENSLDECDNC